MAEPRSDEELLAQAQAAQEGDFRAFEELVERYRGKVKTNCRHLTRSPADAEDLAQEVFVKAYFALERFEGRSAFRTWLQRIKVNHCLNHLKKHEGRRTVPIEEPGLESRIEMKVPDRVRIAEPEDVRVDRCVGPATRLDVLGGRDGLTGSPDQETCSQLP